jgi:HAD superfamily 5'-nucleotidase-like hydrolase
MSAAPEDHGRKSDTLKSLLDVLQHGDVLVDRPHQIYCNRDLNFDKVETVGFDMDYTLAPYHQEAMDELSVRVTLERLVAHRGYPEEILNIESRPDFAIRGLVVDKFTGNIFKMDAHRHVGKGYHGFRPLKDRERYEYRNNTIRLNSDHRYVLIDTLFALPEAFLYAALVDWVETVHRGDDHDYVKIFEDIRFSIDLAHRDDSIKSEIMADTTRFIDRGAALALTLHKLRSSGKKLFVLTNSYPRYTNHVMTYLLDGMLSEYPSWKHYFDIVITGAGKPGFFTERRPFYHVDEEGEVISDDVRQFRRGEIYRGGNLLDFEEMSGMGGETVCYIGDHIYGDIVRSKKSSAWRTVMIVQEMETELRRADELREEIAEMDELDREILRLNQEIAFDRNLAYRLDSVLTADEANSVAERQRMMQARDQLRSRRDRMKHRRENLLERLERAEMELEGNFNPYWGLIFKQGNENTLFGDQVEDYACLYTSRVSNFINYSPLHYFRAPRQLMPHERY